MKTGLVMEGGAMRGMFTAGVIDIMMEHKMEFDGAIGVSAGAVFGCNYKSKQPGRVIRYNAAYCNNPHYAGVASLLRTGDIFGEQFCYHDIPERLDPFDYEAFIKSDTEFYATCTNVETGKAEYIKITDMMTHIDAMRASASMPYVSKIVNYKGMKLLDGGCADSIPVEAFKRMGYDRIVVVLTRETGFVKKPENTKMAEIRYHKYPEFVHTLQNRHNVYNHSLDVIKELERKGEVFVIQPDKKLDISRMENNLEVIQQVYDMGEKDAHIRMKALKDWMNLPEV